MSSLTRFNSSQNGSVCLEHCVVDHLLLSSEGSISRERTGYVTGVAVILATHVKQAGEGEEKREELNT